MPLACGLLLGAFAAEAHHSISGMYDTRRDVRVEGVVTQFEFINPHAFLTLEVRETGVPRSGGGSSWTTGASCRISG